MRGGAGKVFIVNTELVLREEFCLIYENQINSNEDSDTSGIVQYCKQLKIISELK